jgi:hypothetical protein
LNFLLNQNSLLNQNLFELPFEPKTHFHFPIKGLKFVKGPYKYGITVLFVLTHFVLLSTINMII